MDFETAMRIFEFEVESAQDRTSVLKRYRKLSFLYHPDQGGDAENFGLLTEALKVLQKQFGDVLVAKEEEGAKTIDGVLLSELGKGYPITESAKTCEACDGRGYRKYSGTRTSTGEYKTCPTCGGDGLKFYPCKKCGGTGRFKHPKTGKDAGECFKCKGTGKFYPFEKKRIGRRSVFEAFWGEPFNRAPYIPGTKHRGQPCPECLGDKRVEIMTDGRPFYRVCDKCHGIGEEKMWNPVIPRGFLHG